MPPGARGSVAFGNLTEWLHARNSGNTVSWLVKQARFGEFTTLSMGTKTWILLNSGRVVNEIIAKHASVTHERPHFPIAGDLVSRKKRLFLQKTDDWKEGRRFFHQLLLGASSKEHGQIVEAASVGFLRAYLDHPKAWYAHNYRYAVAIMHKILTNKPLEKSRAELDDLQRVTSTFLTAINSSFVEFFLKQLVSPDSSNFGDHAEADNPRMTINAWIMACLAHPAVMQKARAEIEQICGTDAHRLPTLEDMPSLLYMCAVVKEVLRWLDNKDGRHGVEQNLWQYAFSAGRRSCVGYKLAQKELFVAISRLLYCFDFWPAGEFNDMNLGAFNPGEPFPVEAKVRSPAYERLIRDQEAKYDVWGT
ncbi:hypothetical protein QQS21_010732 [Conoideocrella luteorostrata]|uniref:Cytochrome P450 n=1 Tax=Conoideocrella luteorostrata TaxID=1105319 RepID=A0AAJ0FP29_9HYPO|nr:hypothetical protein QQS21_010732 [Conoideocrella luteorostrata]